MIEDTIARIEARLKNGKSLSDQQRHELLTLLETLKSELSNLAKTQPDHARSVAGYLDLSTHEATRQDRKPPLLRHAIEGLSSSVSELEVQHPRLTQLVNSLTVLLSKYGHLSSFRARRA